MSRSLLFLCFKMFERFRINLETAWKRFEQSRRQQGRLTASRGAPAPRCEKPDALPPALSPHNRRVGCSVLPHRGLYRQVLSQATVFCHVPPPPDEDSPAEVPCVSVSPPPSSSSSRPPPSLACRPPPRPGPAGGGLSPPAPPALTGGSCGGRGGRPPGPGLT